MNDLFNKIIAEAKNFSLKEEEKKGIIMKLSSHMKEHPASFTKNPIVSPYRPAVINRGESRHTLRSSLGSGLFTQLLVFKKNTYMPIIILLMIMLGGGTSIAANSTLPGDLLYPIKVNVNEKMESLVAIGDRSDAQFEARLVDKRLEEAEKLALRGKISMEVKNKIKSDFEEHADKLDKLAKKIKENGDEDIAATLDADFESSLKMHDLILAALGAKNEGDKVDLDEIKAAVSIHLNAVAKSRSEDENKVINSDQVFVQAAAQGALRAANNKIAEVEKYINSQKDISVEVQAKATAELNIAKDEVVQGKAKLESKAFGEAFALFKKAHRTAQEAKLVLNSENELKINVNISNSDRDESNNDENKTENKEIEIEGHSQNILDLGL